MARPGKISEFTIILVEVVIFFAIAYLGRQLLDQVLASLGVADLLALAIRFALLAGILFLAVYVDRLVHRFLKDKGLIG